MGAGALGVGDIKREIKSLTQTIMNLERKGQSEV